MSTTPMTADQWFNQLEKFDVPYRELPGFRNSNSGRDDETGLTFGPVFGIGIHHTGSDGSDSSNRDLIVKGRSDLPGPLAQSGLNDDGTIDLITTGRANHFGGGDPDVLAAVKSERYGDYPPHTKQHQGSAGAVDGNDSFYGLECYYYKNLSDEMYASMVGWAAAIADFHGWSEKSVIGHKEWSDWKPDPNLIDMKRFREQVAKRIATVNKPPTPDKPKTLTPAITAAIAANIAYDKALEKIRVKGALASTDEAQRTIREQRRALREFERKQ